MHVSCIVHSILSYTGSGLDLVVDEVYAGHDVVVKGAMSAFGKTVAYSGRVVET